MTFSKSAGSYFDINDGFKGEHEQAREVAPSEQALMFLDAYFCQLMTRSMIHAEVVDYGEPWVK